MSAARRPDADDRKSTNELLSSLADGECPEPAVDEVCRRWRSDPESRARWHAYQLIGDVLRSDELSGCAARDSVFLQQLRTRLKDEPVPLATAPLGPRGRPARRWLPVAAVAAGVMAIGTAIVAMQPAAIQGPTGWDGRVAQSQAPNRGSNGSVMRQVGGAATAASGQTLMIEGQLIRDARLDAYFDAHRGVRGLAPPSMLGGGQRSGESLVPQR